MSRRNLYLWMATGSLALLAVCFVVWQHSHAGPLCPLPRDGYGDLLGTTEQQVEELLGKPDSRGGASILGERDVWEYDSAYRERGAAQPTPLFVHFDVHGRVCRICTFDGRSVETSRLP